MQTNNYFLEQCNRKIEIFVIQDIRASWLMGRILRWSYTVVHEDDISSGMIKKSIISNLKGIKSVVINI